MKTLFEKVQDSIINELTWSLENEKDSWQILDLRIDGVRILAQESTLDTVENAISVGEDDSGAPVINVTIGGNKIITHFNKSQYDNGNFESLKNAFNNFWTNISNK